MPRLQKRLIALFVDSALVATAFWIAIFIRIDDISILTETKYWALLLCTLPFSLFAFIKLGLYRAVLRYMSNQATWAVILGSILSTAFLIAFSFFLHAGLPRTVPFVFLTLTLLFIGGSRIIIRAIVSKAQIRTKEPVIVYGAGSSGRQLATALGQGPEYYVAAFVDDDLTKVGAAIQGVMVYSPSSISNLIERSGIKKVLLALPSASKEKRKEILSRLEPLPVQVLTIPGMADVISGKASLIEFREVGVDDLLGRDPVAPKNKLLERNIAGKTVMVTGAGGSIGSELCRQIVTQKPNILILFEISEFALYSVDKELKNFTLEHELQVQIIPIIGSIQNPDRLLTVMKTYRVDTLYHAAAYKHVPLVEHNVIEGIRNNFFGTLNTAKAAISANVSTFVLVSTDKAVRPTNVMGTTKRLAELVLQALSKEQDTTRFSMVRFGNVLGSSGSVVPLFSQQIRSGGPVTLTHPEITRFFMTIPEAAQLVIQAGAMGTGGDVFVLDMGESVKIIDLAKKMIHLTGFTVKDADNPGGDIEIKCTGLRPGEKLYEELLVGDNIIGTDHERIMKANEIMMEWSELSQLISQFDKACDNFDYEKINELLLSSPAGFTPNEGLSDFIWLSKGRSNRVLELAKAKQAFN